LRDHPVYGPAKAGLAMLTRSLAKDLGPDVRVNGVSPGAILWPTKECPMAARAIIKQTALKRAGTPEDIAAAVLFPRSRRALRHGSDHRRRRRPQRRVVGEALTRHGMHELRRELGERHEHERQRRLARGAAALNGVDARRPYNNKSRSSSHTAGRHARVPQRFDRSQVVA
jgi:hypothetical protein